MSETPQEYTARILSNIEGKNSLHVLKSSPKKIKKLIKGVKKKALMKRPEPNKWSVAEIVAHLAETELVLAWRYRSVVEKNGVTIQPFEQDDWAANSHYGTSDVDDMLELFTVVRKANMKFLSGLTQKQWENYGMHQERGKESITHIVNLEAGHDINHLRQIEKILKH